MRASRSRVVSSFTIVKGALIDETYVTFKHWDFARSCTNNLRRMQETNLIGATSAHWAREVAKALHRRFDPEGRDRPRALLARYYAPEHAELPRLQPR